MIKYKLYCKNCSSNFDSWFSSSKEFEKVKKLKHLNCCFCNSSKIEKTLMAPNLLKTRKNNKENNEKKFLYVKNKIKKYQKFIKENFDYVGDNFTYEARSIHYNEKKNKIKGIYGNASMKDVNELKEEGIETEMIPWINEDSN